MAIVEFTFDVISGLVTEVIQKKIDYTPIPFFERLKIKNRINESLGAVVEPLLPFLANEGISEDKQRRLIQACIDELKPLADNPEQLFQGSLDGQKIFDQLYENRELPQVVIEDGLKDTYTLLCPRIATLLCKIPAAVKDWESEAWTENYRRLDDIAKKLRQIFNSVDEISSSSSRQSDELLSTVRRSLIQKVRFELDLTGLRADRVIQGKFDDFFIHPAIKEQGPDDLCRIVNEPENALTTFSHSNQAIITGNAGSGKSTWSKWFQKESLISGCTGISIRIELRRLKDELPSLHDLIREAASKHRAEDITADYIRSWIDGKQITFILDGFDEIRPSERDNVYEWIVDLKSAVGGCAVVLTSRSLTSNHLERFNDDWERWTILPFDEPRIVDYIQRWYTNTPLLLDGNRSIDGEILAGKWRQDSTIKPLTENPLLLSTLLMVHHLDGELPSGRSALYKRYVEGMLGTWDSRRDVSASNIELSLQQKKQIIRGFAIKLFFEQKEQLDEADTLRWLEGFLGEMQLSLQASEVLAFLRERSGLIVGPGIYGFSHKSIAEYLVAETVFQGDQRDQNGRRIDRFCLFENRNDDRWNTVTFLWAGLAAIADVEAFIEECFDARNWSLAYGVLADQYDRVPSEIRRRLILKSFTLPDFPDLYFEGSTFWVFSLPLDLYNPDQDLQVPSFTLRGLSNLDLFANIIRKAVQDKTIVWEDVDLFGGQIRDALWICFSGKFEDIDVWEACLNSSLPERGLPLHWLQWIGEYVFYRTLALQPLQLKSVVGVYENCRHQTKAIIPMTLISAFFKLLEMRPDSCLSCASDFFEAFQEIEKDKVDVTWLIGTRKWSNTLDAEDSGNGQAVDLLIAFTVLIDEYLRKGELERSKAIDHSIESVHRLITFRESLVREVDMDDV